MNHFSLSLSRLYGFSRTLVAVIATSAVFTAGCANMATTATGANSLNVNASVSGKIHGGNQPVAGATVTLWFAGQGGPGTATEGATTTSATDGSGSFSFVQATSGTPSGNTYVCPSSNTLVYLVAKGGDTMNPLDTTGANNNSASVFLAPLGPCNNNLTTMFVDMTEVTSVPTMAALQQYFDPATETFSTDGTLLALTAMSNAFTTIPNLVSLTTGQAITTQTILPSGAGQGASNTSITATPESVKINTLANILASCRVTTARRYSRMPRAPIQPPPPGLAPHSPLSRLSRMSWRPSITSSPIQLTAAPPISTTSGNSHRHLVPSRRFLARRRLTGPSLSFTPAAAPARPVI
jgi:hypothetical protein